MKLVESILTKNPCYTAGRKITVKGLMLHSVGCPQPKASVFVNGWNIYPLDFASHVTDVLMNTTSATDIHSRVSEHLFYKTADGHFVLRFIAKYADIDLIAQPFADQEILILNQFTHLIQPFLYRTHLFALLS